jgi:phosphoenolpyruvate-protein phosphotransferase (PTS system enzyme I)
MPKSEVCLEGNTVSSGIAIGVPFIIDRQNVRITPVPLAADAVVKEIERFESAIEKSRADILRMKEDLSKEGIKDGLSVLDAHLMIIEDPLFTHDVKEQIRHEKKNAAYIFYQAINRFRKKFHALKDPFFQSRFEDVQDISKRVLAYLREIKETSLSEAPENSIVFARSLSPSEAAESRKGASLAFVTQHGGSMSHTAIVAKAKGIPYVAGVNLSKLQTLKKADCVIVDGLSGKIILNPSEKTKERYLALLEKIRAQHMALSLEGKLGAKTKDGTSIRLTANVEIADDFSLLGRFGAEGVGLFRSEYIVLERGYFPSEEEQYEIYKNLLHHAEGFPVVIRAFDIGLDKVVCSLQAGRELNPALGLRAIRFLLHEKELFKTQMRAILRASSLGDVRILFPMISCLNELLDAKKVVAAAREELLLENHKVAEHVKIGCMIEVPSAAMIVDLIAKECDFLSIGTNDLTQYALAVDRCNVSMSTLYTSTHPGVLRLIQMIVRAANEKNIPVSVCGEIASDPRFVPLLLGLGISELSCSCRFLPIIRHVIRHTKKDEAVELVKKLMTCSFAHEIQEALLSEFTKNVPAGTIDHI